MEELRKILPVATGKPLAQISTLGVGGRAERFVEPARAEEFQSVLALLSDTPLTVLGGGSNVLFPDGVLPGVVLSTRGLDAATWRGDTVEVQAGHPLSALQGAAAARGLSGLEFAAGLPGTVGGAIAGNAGAGGRGVGDLLAEVTTVERDGTLRTWRRGEFEYSYRHCSLSEGGRVILSCVMELQPGESEVIETETRRFREMRASQPRGAKSAGCTFKNPPEGLPAGRLLDECGCKGLTVGDAVVSERHANFILNRAHATAADVLALMELCQSRVLEATGIWLEPEIRVYGPDAGRVMERRGVH